MALRRYASRRVDASWLSGRGRVWPPYLSLLRARRIVPTMSLMYGKEKDAEYEIGQSPQSSVNLSFVPESDLQITRHILVSARSLRSSPRSLLRPEQSASSSATNTTPCMDPMRIMSQHTSSAPTQSSNTSADASVYLALRSARVWRRASCGMP